MEQTPHFCPWPNAPGNLLHDPHWIAVVAGGFEVTLELRVDDCYMNNGIQFAVYEGDPECTGDCEYIGLEDPLAGSIDDPLFWKQFTFPTQPGHTYYLVIDGFNDDICSIKMNVHNGGDPPYVSDPDQPEPIHLPEFEGPDTMCTGASFVKASIPNIPFGATHLIWNIDDGPDIIGQHQATQIEIPSDYLDTMGTMEVCVRAANDCNTSDTVCRTYYVDTIDSVTEQFAICEGQGFIWDNGPIDTDSITVTEVIEQQATRQTASLCQYQAFLELTIYHAPELVDTLIMPDKGTGTGVIEPEFEGGQPSYEFQWSTGDTTQYIHDLDYGIYTLTVTDERGCSEEFSFEVESRIARPSACEAPIICTYQNNRPISFEMLPSLVDCSWPNDSSCTLDDPHWLAFVAKEEQFELTVEVNRCDSMTGVQFSAYRGNPNCMDSCTYSGLVGPLNGDCSEVLQHDSVYQYTLQSRQGKGLWLLFDGYQGDLCEITLSLEGIVDSPGLQQPSPPESIQIQEFGGPDTICTGAEQLSLSVQDLPSGASHLRWYIDSMELEGALDSHSIEVPSLFVDSARNLNVCVQAVNDCGVSEAVCREYVVAPIDTMYEYFEICEGDSFIWDHGLIETDSIDQVQIVEQQALRTGSFGCEYSAKLELTIYPGLTLTDTIITPDDGSGSGSIYPEFSGGQAPYNYNWNTGDTSRLLEGLTSGMYSVTVTDSVGCAGIFSFYVDMQVAVKPVHNTGLKGVEMFPNPLTSDVLHFHWKNPRDHRIRIFNSKGQLLNEFHREANHRIELPSVTALQSGLYIIHIQTFYRHAYYRFIVP